MKYVQPVGEADPNAPYRDRNTGAGVAGSRVPAKAIENPQREIVTVLEAAGLEPDGARVDQLDEAIDLKIAQALGSGSNPVNDLLTILRARNPVFPVINSVGNIFSLSVPSSGVVRIPSGISLTHRGCFNEVTAQQDFNTLANKTYHMRKRWTGGSPGWALVDVSDSGYNPGGALAEGDPAFDTTFDDMISHRVVTDASNVATITALANNQRLVFEFSRAYGTPSGSPLSPETIQYALARTPDFYLHEWAESGISSPSVTNGSETNVVITNRTRYQASVHIASYDHVTATHCRPQYRASFRAL